MNTASISETPVIPILNDKLLFIDIETVGVTKDYKSLPQKHKELFDSYIDWFLKRFPEEEGNDKHEIFHNKAALLPEFGKVVCVSLGWLKNGKLQTKSYWGDEVTLLKELKPMVNKFYNHGYWLCGHNIKTFDIPYISKRMIINGVNPIEYSPRLDTKPWDMKVIDTKEVWQFNNSYSLSSLNLLCVSMGIDSPKGGAVSGENLHDFYYEKNPPTKEQYEEIVHYCEKDITALYEITNKLKLNQ